MFGLTPAVRSFRTEMINDCNCNYYSKHFDGTTPQNNADRHQERPEQSLQSLAVFKHFCDIHVYYQIFTWTRLIFTTPWQNSPDNTFDHIFLFFPETRTQHFMQAVSNGWRQLVWNVKSCFHWRQFAWNVKCCFLGNMLCVKKERMVLTLKAPRKTASENVVCLCCLLNILANF